MCLRCGSVSLESISRANKTTDPLLVWIYLWFVWVREKKWNRVWAFSQDEILPKLTKSTKNPKRMNLSRESYDSNNVHIMTTHYTLITSPGYCCFLFGSFHPPSRHMNTSLTPPNWRLFRGVVGTPCMHFVSSSNVTIFSRGFIGGIVDRTGLIACICCCCCCWWCWCCISCIGIMMVPVERVCERIDGGGERRCTGICCTCIGNAISPTPAKLNSLTLRGTKYSMWPSNGPADRLAGVFLWNARLDRLGNELNVDVLAIPVWLTKWWSDGFSQDFGVTATVTRATSSIGPVLDGNWCIKWLWCGIKCAKLFCEIPAPTFLPLPGPLIVDACDFSLLRSPSNRRNHILISDRMRLMHIAMTAIPIKMYALAAYCAIFPFGSNSPKPIVPSDVKQKYRLSHTFHAWIRWNRAAPIVI